MCRFLIGGDNSFAIQSLGQLDGWGVAHYEGGQPQITRGILPAICDDEFERVSLSVSSSTVVAHIRRATSGPVHLKNCHPFQHGRWVFAHNGFIRNHADVRARIFERVAAPLQGFVLGDTDTELLFYLWLSRLAERVDLDEPSPPEAIVTEAMSRTLEEVRALADVGPPCATHHADESWFNSVLSNGRIMMGTCWGRPLSFRRGVSGGKRVVTLSTEFIGVNARLDAEHTEDTWVELHDREYVFIDADVQLSAGRL